MAQQKSTSLKVFLLDEQGYQIEVRRFGVDQDITFIHLCSKLKVIFSILQTLPFQVSWKDADGDDIIVSSDEELQEALSGDSECFKLCTKLLPAAAGVKKGDDPDYSSFSSVDESVEPVVHSNVVCDGCENEIQGTRFKCLQCEDYDLCRSCENTGIHAKHAMLRLCKPIVRNKAHKFHKFCQMSRRLFENNLMDDKPTSASQPNEQMHNFLKLKETLEGFCSPSDFDLVLYAEDNSEPTVLFSTENKSSSKCEQSVASQTESVSTESSSDLSQDPAACNTTAEVPVKEEKHSGDPKPAEVQSNFIGQPDATTTRNNGTIPQNLYPTLGYQYPSGPMPARPQQQYTPMYYPAAPMQNLTYPGYTRRPSTDMYAPFSSASSVSTRNIPVVNSPFLYSTSSGCNATYNLSRPVTGQGTRPTFNFTNTSASVAANRSNPIGPTMGTTVPFVQFSNPVVNPPVPPNLPEPLVPTPASTARLPTAPAAPARTVVPPTPANITAEQRKEMELWNAVEKLAEMGFSNHDGRVFHIVQIVDGNIDRAIERLIQK